jgi:L-aspartate oxidase
VPGAPDERDVEKVGVLRRADQLAEAVDELRALGSALDGHDPDVPEYEFYNLLTLATQTAKCALLREESRGVHLREDFPKSDDAWVRHLTLRLPDLQLEPEEDE